VNKGGWPRTSAALSTATKVAISPVGRFIDRSSGHRSRGFSHSSRVSGLFGHDVVADGAVVVLPYEGRGQWF
jgi:hypothetical protein